jgi:dethiobiotin synthetase
MNIEPLLHLKGIFVTGTGTDVGKTYASTRILQALMERGKSVLYYKPIQCGEPADADAVKAKIGENPLFSCANTYFLKTPSSPHYAFAVEDAEFNPNEVYRFVRAHTECDLMLVEGAGGIRVPIDDQNDMANLALLTGFPALVVARPDLGTINHSLLTLGYLREKGVPTVGFVFSGFGCDPKDPMIADNHRTIEKISGSPFLGFV